MKQLTFKVSYEQDSRVGLLMCLQGVFNKEELQNILFLKTPYIYKATDTDVSIGGDGIGVAKYLVPSREEGSKLCIKFMRASEKYEYELSFHEDSKTHK